MLEEVLESAIDGWEAEDVLQNILCRCWSETGIPILKGHSRLNVAEMTGKRIFEIASPDGYELASYCSPDSEKLRAGKADAGNEKKIDPEAACPCGSGKRYRQCCGRKAPGANRQLT